MAQPLPRNAHAGTFTLHRFLQQNVLLQAADRCTILKFDSEEGVQGKDTIPFLEKLVVGDIQSVKNGSGTLSVFTNENGGIIDDTVITKVRGLIMPIYLLHSQMLFKSGRRAAQ